MPEESKQTVLVVDDHEAVRKQLFWALEEKYRVLQADSRRQALQLLETEPINVVGHAGSWDEIAIDGDIASRDVVVRYKRAGRVLAVASIYRDIDSLKAEVSMEQGVVAGT